MNFGTPVPLLIGIVLILGAVGLFFLDRLKPGYGRDADKVYAILWLVCGIFLLGHLQMELLASFQQLILVGMLISITIENVLSRVPREGPYANQVGPEVVKQEDYYRPARPASYSRSNPRMSVRAEIDKNDPYLDRYADDRRMLRGREDAARRRPDYYGDDYSDRYPDDRYSDRPGSTSERPAGQLNPSKDRIRRRRPRSVDARYDTGASSRGWDESASGGYSANSGGYSANQDSYSANSGGYSAHSGGYSSHASSPPSTYGQQDNGRDSDSYVDYRPVDPSDDESRRPSSDYGSRY